MTTSQLTLTCNACKQASQYAISDELKGSTLTFKCKHCQKKLKYFFPKENDNNLENPTNTAYINEQPVVDGYLESVTKKGSERNIYKLLKEENIIGRESINGQRATTVIATDDLSMSRAHCIIKKQKNSRSSMVYTIQDNNSVNGVILNGRPLAANEEVYLCHEDKIILGKTALIFKEVYAS